MDIDELRTFITAAECGSYSKTGDLLNLTQPAVSKRIASLENKLGTALFDAVGRQRILNEAGVALLPKARDILQCVDDAKQFMHDRAGKIEGELHIATSHHIGLHRLPEKLQSFSEQFPQVHLQLNFIDSDQAIEAILQNQCDLALMTLNNALLNEGINTVQHQVLWEDELCFVIGENHPLANVQQISLKELVDHTAILPDRNTHTTQLINQRFEEEDLAINIAMTTNHLDAIKMLVSIGLGWSVLPKSLLDESLIELNTQALPLTRQLGCIFHRERTLSNAARAFLNTLKRFGGI